MTTTTQTLASWLLEQIAADEAVARAAIPPRGGDDGEWRVEGSYGEPNAEGCVVDGIGIHIYDEGGHDHDQAVHIARHDPAHVLAVCAAHRAIVELWVDAELAYHNIASVEEWPSVGRGMVERAGYSQAAMALRQAVDALALAYADRPGWREEWAV